jgi:hypothetical protein
MPGAKKSKMPLLLGIVGAVVVIVVVLALAWLLFFSPQAQSKRVANAFMNDMAKGDVAAATKISSDGTSNDTQSFLKSSAPVVKGTATAGQSTFKDNVRYSLYTLSGAQRKYARVTVDKEGGKWVAQSFVFSNTSKAQFPAKSGDTTSTGNPTAAATTSTTDTAPAKTASATACFGANDFTVLNPYPIDAYSDGRYTWTDSVFFNADAATYAYPSIMDDFYAKYKTWYQQHSSMQFTVELQGEVNSTNPDNALANQRANLVKNDFTSKAGIPGSLVKVVAPTNYGTSLGAGDDGSQNRNVSITINSPESCITKH